MADVFTCNLKWSGAEKGPTRDPSTFSRDMEVTLSGGRVLDMSAAPGYRGDPSRANPEELLVASLSACQALTYLFLAARAGIAVVAYSDKAEGHLGTVEQKIRMTRISLQPSITLQAGADEPKARALVEKAHAQCFVANSVTARVDIKPVFKDAQVESVVS